MNDPDSVNRREFLGTAGAAGLMLGSQSAARSAAAAERDEWPKLRPARIYKIYTGRSGVDSRGVLYLTWSKEEVARLDKYLQDLEKRLGDVTFIGGETIPPADVAEVAARAESADGMLVIHLSGHGTEAAALDRLFGLGVPAVLFFQPFSGHGWMFFQQWKDRKTMMLSTSDWSDIDQAVNLLRVPALMKQSRILAVNGPRGTAAGCSPEEVKKKFGTDLVTVPNTQILEIAKSIDPKAAEAEAQQYWISQARRIVEPTRQEIIDSARYYLAVKQLMIKENAQAICSAACMGSPRGCLTFSKLNDLGLVGACEGDVDSTLTMLLFAYAFHVPGFITDPVVDTAKNTMVQFHCTSATMLDGPGSKRMPFVMRNQTDSGGGVALEVRNRVGQPVTMAKLVNLDTMLVVPGRITGTSASPLACRTQFSQSVRDARHLFLNWGAGAIKTRDAMTLLHRVVFYGDHVRAVEGLGNLMGFKVIEEDRPV